MTAWDGFEKQSKPNRQLLRRQDVGQCRYRKSNGSTVERFPDSFPCPVSAEQHGLQSCKMTLSDVHAAYLAPFTSAMRRESRAFKPRSTCLKGVAEVESHTIHDHQLHIRMCVEESRKGPDLSCASRNESRGGGRLWGARLLLQRRPRPRPTSGTSSAKNPQQ